MNRRFLLALTGAVFFGLMAILVANAYLQKKARDEGLRQQVNVVIAKVDIPIGSTIQESQIEEYPYPRALEAGVAKDKKSVVGKVAAYNIAARAPVLNRYLAAAGTPIGLSGMVQAGNRAYTVSVNEASSVAGFVSPGNFVDIISVMQSSGSVRPVAKTILQNIKVLASGNQLQPVTDASQNTARQQSVSSVTLEVTPNQAETLALATREGNLQLVIRNPNDKDIATTAGVRASNMLGPVEPEPRPVATATPGRARTQAPFPSLTIATPTPTPAVVATVAPTPALTSVDVYRGKTRDTIQFPAKPSSAGTSAKPD
ncbi:MAG TPA: Flp pilus assembly protein CpaB [Blastocatellia bacterium]|nr:Flp pilus assembly protein CpaB [Blastocatellia bacterium]